MLGETPGLLDCLFCFCFQQYTELVPSAPSGTAFCLCVPVLMGSWHRSQSHVTLQQRKGMKLKGRADFLFHGVLRVRLSLSDRPPPPGARREQSLQVGLAAEDSGPLSREWSAHSVFPFPWVCWALPSQHSRRAYVETSLPDVLHPDRGNTEPFHLPSLTPSHRRYKIHLIYHLLFSDWKHREQGR